MWLFTISNYSNAHKKSCHASMLYVVTGLVFLLLFLFGESSVSQPCFEAPHWAFPGKWIHLNMTRSLQAAATQMYSGLLRRQIPGWVRRSSLMVTLETKKDRRMMSVCQLSDCRLGSPNTQRMPVTTRSIIFSIYV